MSTLNCQQSRSLLMAWLDSELDAVTTVEIGEHLATCSACRARFDAEQAIESGLRQRLLTEQMPEDVWARLQDTLDDELEEEYDDEDDFEDAPVLRWPRMQRWIPYVAAAVVLVASVLMLRDSASELRSAGEVREQLLQSFLSAHAVSQNSFVAGAEAVPAALHDVGFDEFVLPETGFVAGHTIDLLGASTFPVEGQPWAEIRYQCCGAPVSVFVVDGDSFGELLEDPEHPAPDALTENGVYARASQRGELLVGIVSRHRTALSTY